MLTERSAAKLARLRLADCTPGVVQKRERAESDRLREEIRQARVEKRLNRERVQEEHRRARTEKRREQDRVMEEYRRRLDLTARRSTRIKQLVTYRVRARPASPPHYAYNGMMCDVVRVS